MTAKCSHIGPTSLGISTQYPAVLSSTLSLVVFRHPLARLSSVYHNKLVDKADTEFRNVARKIKEARAR